MSKHFYILKPHKTILSVSGILQHKLDKVLANVTDDIDKANDIREVIKAVNTYRVSVKQLEYIIDIMCDHFQGISIGLHSATNQSNSSNLIPVDERLSNVILQTLSNKFIYNVLGYKFVICELIYKTNTTLDITAKFKMKNIIDSILEDTALTHNRRSKMVKLLKNDHFLIIS